jgi:hypothetical protein
VQAPGVLGVSTTTRSKLASIPSRAATAFTCATAGSVPLHPLDVSTVIRTARPGAGESTRPLDPAHAEAITVVVASNSTRPDL